MQWNPTLAAVSNLYYRVDLLDRATTMVTLAFKAPKPPPAADEKSDFASRVRSARKALGLSQQALSNHSSIPISTLKNYELGHSSPSAENLQRMHAAGINPMWVLLGHKPILNRDAKASMARIAATKASAKQPTAKPKVKPTTKASLSKPSKPGSGVLRPLSAPGATAPKKETNDA